MKVNLVDEADFLNMGDEWNELTNYAKTTIFDTFEWLSTLWKHIRRERVELFIIKVMDDGELVGLAPLIIRKMLGIKIISHLGDGPSDYCNLILKETKKISVIKRIILYLFNEYTDWDIILLNDVPDTFMLTIVRALSRLPYIKWFTSSLCPYINYRNLAENWDNFVLKLSPKTRKHVRRALRMVDKFKVKFVEGTANDLQMFIDLHQKRWINKGEKSILSSQIMKDFHNNIAKKFAEKNWLDLSFLVINDKAISSVYGFRYKRKFY